MSSSASEECVNARRDAQQLVRHERHVTRWQMEAPTACKHQDHLLIFHDCECVTAPSLTSTRATVTLSPIATFL